MTDTQVEAILMEVLRVMRSFSEAMRLILEQKAEIIALQRILEDKGVASTEELEAIRRETLNGLTPAGEHLVPPGIDVMQLDDDGKWKM